MAAEIGHDTAERRANAIALLDADLHGLLQIKEVPEVLQAKLSVARVRSISKLSTIADDRAGMRTFCRDHLQLDQAGDMVDIASLVDTWEASNTRMRVRHKAEAEANLASIPRSVPKVEIQDLISRFQNMHGYKLEDKNTPATTTLEIFFDQMEAGELKNLTLKQLVSREDAESELIGATIDKGTGTIKIRKGFGECPLPKSPEELRRRMSVLSHAFLLSQLKFPQKAVLKELRPVHFLKYVEYLLGEHVFGLKAVNKDGDVLSSPALETVMSYDFQMRRHMVRLVNEGENLVEALTKVMADATLKERYFVTPNVMFMAAPPSSSRDSAPRSRSPKSQMQHSHPYSFSKGKGKGKGKGKFWLAGKGKKGLALHDTSPDGRQICWKWNSPHDRCRFDCGRLHVCMKCFKKHPYHSCPDLKKDMSEGKGSEGNAS
eukprot:s1708_g5.t1